jgi:hypothetical protein
MVKKYLLDRQRNFGVGKKMKTLPIIQAFGVQVVVFHLTKIGLNLLMVLVIGKCHHQLKKITHLKFGNCFQIF